MRHASIRIRAAVPDPPALPTVDYSWGRTAHVGATELTPGDIPRPLGGLVRMVSHVDSDLHHNMLNGEAVTAILHFLNQTQQQQQHFLSSTKTYSIYKEEG